MENEMLSRGLQVMTKWLYGIEVKSVGEDHLIFKDCEQYLATHHEKEIALTHAMIVIVDVAKNFREGK